MARILVVDDEEDMQTALANTLQLAGHTVTSTGDGRTALEKIKQEELDVVLLDLRLPGMDGVEVLKQIKQEKPLLPVIMLTGYGSVDVAIETMKIGASDYISKPFENEDLFQRIQKALSIRAVSLQSGPLSQRLLEKLTAAETQIPQPSVSSAGTALSSRRRLYKWSLGGASALALAFAFLWAAFMPKQAVYDIPTSHLSGLSWGEDRIWMADWFAQMVYECRLEGDSLVVVKSHRVPKIHPTGIAWAGDSLYLSDSWSKKISRHALDAALTVMLEVPSPHPAPSALFWGGKGLWSSDLRADRILQHAYDADLTILKSHPISGTAHIGFSLQGNSLWAADADTKRIYHYLRKDGALTLASAYSHPILREQTKPLSAFLLQGREVWLGFEGLNKLHRIPLKQLEKVK